MVMYTRRFTNDSPEESFTTTNSSPLETKSSMSFWTPGCYTGYSSSEDEDDRSSDLITAYNKTMESLSEAACEHRPSILTYQLKDWDSASIKEKTECQEKASEACSLLCKVIAPNDGERLFQSLYEHKPTASNELVILMKAFAKAPTRSLKTQILSLYAYEYPVKTLQELHEPYARLTQWQIRRARAHAKMVGPGHNVTKPVRHRISLDMKKVDHFVDFINRPYYHQDVAFGTRTLKLDSGASISMPNVVRTVTRSTMIAQYLQYCRDEGCLEPLSTATLYRILEVREASQRKSLQGLDNTAAEGSSSFQTLRTITEHLAHAGAGKTWSIAVNKRLDAAKQYLKTNYKVNCGVGHSLVADHCKLYALSDPTDTDFQALCDHQHPSSCSSCEDLKAVLREIENVLQNTGNQLSEEERGDLLHDLNEAKTNIFKWKAHILRSVNQEKAKHDVIEILDESSALLVMDWAMKFTQVKFREKQSEWYGKRGISWHVSSTVSKDTEKKTTSVTSYVHLINSCSQDWFSVLSIVEDLFSNIKADNPRIQQVYLRSDEAGCYHNNLLIAALKDVGDRVGVSVKQYDFSEPQQGKDICDRIICPLKSSIRKYCNEGNDILRAEDMYAALDKYPVRGTTCSVSRINDSVTQLEVRKLSNFSSFHNFKYDQDGITARKAYGIGKGKKFFDKEIFKKRQSATQLHTDKSFTEIRELRKSKSTCEVKTPEEEDGLYFCPEPNCNYTFTSIRDLEHHMDVGAHSRFVENETIYDTLRREWASKYTTISTSASQSSVPTQSDMPSTQDQTQLPMGWALSKTRVGSARFPQKVRHYLIKKFELGELTGNKADPSEVAREMRITRTESGNRMFSRNEWLTKTQIKGFFSRLAKLRRKGIVVSDVVEVFDCERDDDDDDEEEKESREELIEEIFSKLHTKHPVIFESYDLCELHSEGKLAVFKVTMLKDICKYFELKFTSKDKKADLITVISSFIEQCSCTQ